MKFSLQLAPIVLCSALVVLPACDKNRDDRAPGSENSPGMTGAPGAPASTISDSDLEKAIRAKLESDDALKPADLSVSADAEDNKATISGSVASQELRAKAVDLAKSAHPGITIEDKIDVKPAT